MSSFDLDIHIDDVVMSLEEKGYAIISLPCKNGELVGSETATQVRQLLHPRAGVIETDSVPLHEFISDVSNGLTMTSHTHAYNVANENIDIAWHQRRGQLRYAHSLPDSKQSLKSHQNKSRWPSFFTKDKRRRESTKQLIHSHEEQESDDSASWSDLSASSCSNDSLDLCRQRPRRHHRLYENNNERCKSNPTSSLISDLRQLYSVMQNLSFSILESIEHKTRSQPQLDLRNKLKVSKEQSATNVGMDINLKEAYGDNSCLLDIFYYYDEGCKNDVRLQPCPAHTDPGLLTVITDDTPGLQVWEKVIINRQETWGWSKPIVRTSMSRLMILLLIPTTEKVLNKNDVVVITNRQLEQLSNGRFKACRHRVAHVPSANRASYIFEVRANLIGQVAAQTAILQELQPGQPVVQKMFPRYL
eukprot:m.168345 g.168345  ORF g.168345 m.168345 type:complete len:417 (+) comp15316_c0_seq9:109-1359(+)